ncbi:hypothetical protein DD597_15070 [Enterobacter cloacae complex sp. 677-3DZ2D5B]|nr:hypothetical protein DD597_15070 [Enterobacter cloacae complex sp. 677-3DZ2D5B]RYA65408.1 hypothetical protein DD599_08005 [Enterobacter cloacae complex sp. CH23B]RYA71827.1 hypothetical protein DD598_07220 [Enterobacter cloacae complex sp. 2DZ2F16B1]
MNVITCSNVPIFTAHHVAQYDACLYQAPANYTGAFFSPSYFKPQPRWSPRSPRSLTDVSSRGFAALPPCCNLNYFGENVRRVGRVRRSRHPAQTTASSQSIPHASGPDSLRWFYCDRPGRGIAPAIR